MIAVWEGQGEGEGERMGEGGKGGKGGGGRWEEVAKALLEENNDPERCGYSSRYFFWPTIFPFIITLGTGHTLAIPRRIYLTVILRTCVGCEMISA